MPLLENLSQTIKLEVNINSPWKKTVHTSSLLFSSVIVKSIIIIYQRFYCSVNYPSRQNIVEKVIKISETTFTSCGTYYNQWTGWQFFWLFSCLRKKINQASKPEVLNKTNFISVLKLSSAVVVSGDMYGWSNQQWVWLHLWSLKPTQLVYNHGNIRIFLFCLN